MTSFSIISQFNHFRHGWAAKRLSRQRPNLQQLAQQPAQLPRFVRESPVAMRYLNLLSPLAWAQFPERNLLIKKGFAPVPYAPFVGACLIKLDQHLLYMSQLWHYLVEHPALVWLLGFPLVPSRHFPWGFDAGASLPTPRHLTRMLREIPNSVMQFLLDSSVSLLQIELQQLGLTLGEAISIDTKHIVAAVVENNPKAYVKISNRLDKTRQPKGDPDCKLGCKRKRNQPPAEEDATSKKARRATNFSANDEYFWGYASGVVATKIPDWGEFVLAELTLPFDQPDVAYFYPLMADVERRLGFRPKYAAFDAAFDAFYIYEYFFSEEHDGFAAVPFTQRGGYKRLFDQQGWPLCQAKLPMPLKYTFWSKKSTLVEHERGRHVCPLLFPEVTGQSCPIEHKQWLKGGCTTTMPTSIGARIRYQLDRHSDAYKLVYKQRTANERINSQAEALGIEHPKIRNQRAIANQNTLIYVLINLRALHRIRRKKSERQN